MEQVQELRKSFGQRVREAREQAGLTQAFVAKALAERGFRVGHTTVAKIEAGDRATSVEEAVALADILNVGVEPLAVGGVAAPDSDPYTTRALNDAQASLIALGVALKRYVDARDEVVRAMRFALRRGGHPSQEPDPDKRQNMEESFADLIQASNHLLSFFPTDPAAVWDAALDHIGERVDPTALVRELRAEDALFDTSGFGDGRA